MAQKSILIFSNGEILGDGLIKLPALYALRAALPNARIVWAGRNSTVYETLLASLVRPLNIEFVKIPKADFSIKGLLTGPKVMNGHTFDFLVDTQRVWFKSLVLSRLVAHKHLVNSRKVADQSHFLDQMLALFSKAAGQDLTATPLPLPDETWAKAAAIALPPGRRYVGLVVGAGQPHKRWPLERFIRLGHDLLGAGFTPVVIAGPAERDLVPVLEEQLPQATFPNTAMVDVETKNVCYSIALAQRLDAAIANDGGAAHVVSAGMTNVLMLARKPSTIVKFLPRVPVVDTALAPDFGGDKMDMIPYDVVWEKTQALLAKTKPRL